MSFPREGKDLLSQVALRSESEIRVSGFEISLNTPTETALRGVHNSPDGAVLCDTADKLI